MSQRNLVWTALPAGFADTGNTLRLTVHLAPRLVTANGADGTLAEFPELLDWPATAGPLRFTVEIQGGASVATTRVAVPAPESVLWKALFNAGTLVRSHRFDDRSSAHIRSYPTRELMASVKGIYQAVAVQSPDTLPTRAAFNFTDGGRMIADLVPLALNDPQQEQHIAASIAVELKRARAVPRGFGDLATQYYQVRLFHAFDPPRDAAGKPLPLPAQTLPRLDFHQVVGSLGHYPEMLRRLALAFDLELPATLPPQGRLRVVPALAGSAPMTPWTAYVIDPGTRSFLVDGPATGDVRQGMLQLAAEHYDVVELDVDGAARKVMEFAYNLGRLNGVRSTPGSAQGFGLPALRSGGFSVTRDGRASALSGRFARARSLNDELQQAPQNGPVLTADDVVRGYRVDVWDSHSRHWHSLCWRQGHYDFGGGLLRNLAADEGFVSLGTTQPTDGSDPALRLPESLFRWAGWSLAVRRIGRTVGSDSTPADPGNEPQTEFKLKVEFKPVKGTLPRLRFGTSYQFRARAVDMAGNSLAPDAAIDAGFSIPAKPVTYLRYEPVAAPPLVLRAPLGPTSTPGESLERIVIRSNFDAPATAVSERHLAPPKVAQELAEVHGMFDTPSGLDRTAYAKLVARDGDFGIDAAHPDQPLPHPEAQLALPYLPDPLARGAAFRHLPGTPPGSVYRIADFPGHWPDLRTFRLRLAEGSAPPSFSESENERVLTVFLRKAEQVAVPLSCALDAAGLAKLALWDRIVAAAPPDLAALQAAALDGGHWMLTPPRVLTLVHAVRQPLLEPRFQGLRTIRAPGETHARLIDEIAVDGSSTIRVDLQSHWEDPVDDGVSAGAQPVTTARDALAFAVDVTSARAVVLPLDGLQQFHDTRYHRVRYTAVATSRFREYFPDSLTRPAADFQRAGFAIELDIPNSARPPAPQVLYVLPTFDWSEASEGSWSVHRRGGGGLRVYLDRPWYASGAGELLGVVLQGCAPPPHAGFAATATPDFLKPYVTQWGRDPIWDAPPPPSQTQPLAEHFTRAALVREELTLEELAAHPEVPLTVVGHPVAYDQDRRLWYCEIAVDPGLAYFPFIRLALVRLQPHSLPDAHLSRVVLADFMQLVPGRTTSLAFDGADPTRVRLAVAGHSQRQAARTRLQVTIELQPKSAAAEPAWVPVQTLALPATPGPGGDGETLWTLPLVLPVARGAQPMRLRVEEFEVLPTGNDRLTQDRLVYAELLAL